jgi:hypothetical protein
MRGIGRATVRMGLAPDLRVLGGRWDIAGSEMTAVLLAFLLAGPSSPSSPTSVAQDFYAQIVKHHPTDIPTGYVKRAIWPLLSSRLASGLEALQACEDDYFRRYGTILKAEQLKPTIGWLEYGLFSGGNEEALPAEVKVARVEPRSEGAMQVDLEFTYRDTFETYGRPPDDSNTFRWKGRLLVAREGGRYVIDDYVPIDEKGEPQTPLSRQFPECKRGRWVGTQPY